MQGSNNSNYKKQGCEDYVICMLNKSFIYGILLKNRSECGKNERYPTSNNF